MIFKMFINYILCIQGHELGYCLTYHYKKVIVKNEISDRMY